MRNRREEEIQGIRLPPQNIEAEESVLAAVLTDNRDLNSIREIIEPEDFYRTAHQKIFTAILELVGQGKPVDLVTLTEQLRKNEQLEEIGGAVYLANLLDAPAQNPASYAKIIRENAAKRQVISDASKVTRMAIEGATLDEIQVELAEMSSAIRKKMTTEKMEKMEISFENLQGYFHSLTETPFESLNQAIGGFAAHELIVIGGRTGMGKTSLVLECLAHTVIKQNKPVIYCGAYGAKEEIFARLMAQRCRIPLKEIRGGRITAEDKLEKIRQFCEQINPKLIYNYVIKGGINILSLQTIILKAIEKEIKEEPGFIIIENLQELFWPGKNFRNDREQVDFIVEKIKPFCYEINPPIITSSQLYRDLEDREDKRPMTSDLIGKKAEEYCNKILLLNRPNAYINRIISEEGRPERDAEIIVAKGGAPVILPFTFLGEYLSWEEREAENE